MVNYRYRTQLTKNEKELITIELEKQGLRFAKLGEKSKLIPITLQGKEYKDRERFTQAKIFNVEVPDKESVAEVTELSRLTESEKVLVESKLTRLGMRLALENEVGRPLRMTLGSHDKKYYLSVVQVAPTNTGNRIVYSGSAPRPEMIDKTHKFPNIARMPGRKSYAL